MQKIRLLACSLLILGLSLTSHAQGIFGATLLAGFNAAQIDGDDEVGFNKVGLNLGIRGDIYVTDKIQAGMELTWSQRGSRSPIFTGQDFVGPQLKIDVDYIQVPVIVKFNDWYIEEGDYYRVNVLAGFSYGRLISSKAVDSKFDGMTNELFKKNDIGLHLGASYLFNEKWGITIRWNRGLTRVFDHRDSPLISRSLVSRYLTFRLEYSL